MVRPRTSWQQLVGRMVAVSGLLLFFALALDTVRRESPTTDEPLHITRGFTLSQTGELHLQYEHTPLSHRLIGLFLGLDSDAPDVRRLDSWSSADIVQLSIELLWGSNIDLDRTMFLARLPIVWVGLLLGAVIMSWAHSWLGREGFIVSVALFAAAPNLLAASSLATTDLTLTTTYFATVYFWWRYWKTTRHSWLLLTAVLLGLALAAKLTAVLLLPLLLLLGFVSRRRNQSWARAIWAWLALLPLALFVLWMVYGFEINSLSGPTNLRVPLATYLNSWQSTLSHVQTGHLAYFLGELSSEGWWYYFPVSYLIKTPIVTLLLLLIGLAFAAFHRALWRTGLFLILPSGTLFVVASASRLNIGIRHILPIVPFLLVLAATAAIPLGRRPLTKGLLGLALAIYLVVGIARHPHHLAYFNELVGGTEGAYRVAGDSNLDWGQDLKLLSDYVGANGGEWHIAYDGPGDPLYFGLTAENLIDEKAGEVAIAAANPKPGQYAISANYLQGIVDDTDLFDWFRRREPQTSLGGSILIYDVVESAEGEWIAHCLDPIPLLSQQESEAVLGQPPLRHISFDCRQSWVLPDNGAPGWYILPQAESWWFADELLDDRGELLQIVYRHAASELSPSYEVYYWSGGEPPEASANSRKDAKLKNGRNISLPYAVSDFVDLVGYWPGGRQWMTQWSVLATPSKPLSLQAHLYPDVGAAPLVADSLGYSSDQWRPGDWFVQRHNFPDSNSDGKYLETGTYNYLTLEAVGELIQLPR